MDKKIYEIKNEFLQYPIENINDLINKYKSDERQGVKRIINSYIKAFNKYEKEKERLILIQQYEKTLYKKGYTYIAGIDEVGRGPLAGPVISCAIILPQDINIQGINDSKKLSKDKRNNLFTEIKRKALDIGIGIVEPEKIDQINILNATKLSMNIALSNLKIKPDYILIDAINLPNIQIPQKSIIKGDEKSISIAAASIIAKVTRDAIMEEYHKVYPFYNFNTNMGYGSLSHTQAIKNYGLCPIHRRTFTKNFV